LDHELRDAIAAVHDELFDRIEVHEDHAGSSSR